MALATACVAVVGGVSAVIAARAAARRHTHRRASLARLPQRAADNGACHAASSADAASVDAGGATVPSTAAAAAAARRSSPNLGYLDQFVQLTCAPAMLRLRLFPDAKEITESMACVHAVRQHLRILECEPASGHGGRGCSAIVVVGDGFAPRTGAIMAFLFGGAGWDVYSVDPELRLDTVGGAGADPGAEAPGAGAAAAATASRTTDDVDVDAAGTARAEWGGVRGLTVARAKIQDVVVRCERAIIVMMHAHVSVADAAAAVVAPRGVAIVTCPCCGWGSKQHKWQRQRPSIVYNDDALLSDHREIRVWEFRSPAFVPGSAARSLAEARAQARHARSAAAKWVGHTATAWERADSADDAVVAVRAAKTAMSVCLCGSAVWTVGGTEGPDDAVRHAAVINTRGDASTRQSGVLGAAIRRVVEARATATGDWQLNVAAFRDRFESEVLRNPSGTVLQEAGIVCVRGTVDRIRTLGRNLLFIEVADGGDARRGDGNDRRSDGDGDHVADGICSTDASWQLQAIVSREGAGTLTRTTDSDDPALHTAHAAAVTPRDMQRALVPGFDVWVLGYPCLSLGDRVSVMALCVRVSPPHLDAEVVRAAWAKRRTYGLHMRDPPPFWQLTLLR